jgi:hypothetical protein
MSTVLREYPKWREQAIADLERRHGKISDESPKTLVIERGKAELTLKAIEAELTTV